MGYLKKYRLNFRDLETGIHNFAFEIEDRFFANFEKSEIQEGKLKARVELTKEERLITLDIFIDGEVNVMCDRCLDYFMYPIHFKGILYIKPEDEVQEDNEEVIKITPDQSFVNLAQYLYESIHLTLPLKRTHPDDEKGNSTCNSEMLKLLRQYQREEDEETIDPRWEKLKHINVKRN
ncbi:MAG: YceD family protein [Bacteroidales bacterium]